MPEGVVRSWLDRVGKRGARVLARHLPPPALTETGGPGGPPLTEFVLSRFEDDDEVFQEFLAGTHAGQVYSGDIPAQHEEEAETARRFLGHPLRRVREWAVAEVQSANARRSSVTATRKPPHPAGESFEPDRKAFCGGVSEHFSPARQAARASSASPSWTCISARPNQASPRSGCCSRAARYRGGRPGSRARRATRRRAGPIGSPETAGPPRRARPRAPRPAVPGGAVPRRPGRARPRRGDPATLGLIPEPDGGLGPAAADQLGDGPRQAVAAVWLPAGRRADLGGVRVGVRVRSRPGSASGSPPTASAQACRIIVAIEARASPIRRAPKDR